MFMREKDTDTERVFCASLSLCYFLETTPSLQDLCQMEQTISNSLLLCNSCTFTCTKIPENGECELQQDISYLGKFLYSLHHRPITILVHLNI